MTLAARQPDETAPAGRGSLDKIANALRALRRRWWWIALATALALLAGLLLLLLVAPRYVATAQILIDPRPVAQGVYGSFANGPDTSLIETQVEVIRSNAVLRRIVEREKLQDDSEFEVHQGAGDMRMLLRNALGRALFGSEGERPPATDPIGNTVRLFAARHLRVARLGNTYVINVSVMSRDATKAARLANAVAEAYISDQVRAADNTAREATQALQSRIADLRGKVATAEREVETFRSDPGLLGSPNLPVTEHQLQQTNDKLVLARSQTALAKARYDQLKDLSARRGSALLGVKSGALKSPALANLRAGLSRVERREAIIQQSLRPAHPDYANVIAEKRALVAQIEDELTRIKANARSEYDLALNNERALTAALTSLQTETTKVNQAQARLRELQREAQAAQMVLEQFLARAQETGEHDSLIRDNSRMIGRAAVPPYPTFPATTLVLASALLLGLGGGTAAAWVAHMRDGTRPREYDPPLAPVAPQPRRLRKRLTFSRASAVRVAVPDASETDAHAAPPPSRIAPSLPTLTRLPAIEIDARGSHPRDSFSSCIAAVDDASSERFPGYRAAIDSIIADLPVAAPGMATVAMLVGTSPSGATSRAALSLAYRAAMTGRRTLLIDVAGADPRLSEAFAANLVQRRACVLDSEQHLAEITLRDERTGLSILPIALAGLSRLGALGQQRLVAGLRKLSRRYDLLIMDAGTADSTGSMAFLADIADRVWIVTPPAQVQAAARRDVTEAAARFRSRSGSAAIIETGEADARGRDP